MPELPEVEVTKRGISPCVESQVIVSIVVRQTRLRWPVPVQDLKMVVGQQLQFIARRGKYLLFSTAIGAIIIHLGMSGKLQVVEKTCSVGKHDHVELHFSNQIILRFTDPRRFGCVLFTAHDPLQHKLLKALGPEPLEHTFNANYLYQKSRKRNIPIKSFIMNSAIVAGVGNIYATETLYRIGLNPLISVGAISKATIQRLVVELKKVLQEAIDQGGTTLKDFAQANGQPGYFQLALLAYGRAGKPCYTCQIPLELIRLGQRATVFCPQCQKI